MLPVDPCYPKTATSTRVSSISLLRSWSACASHAVPGEPGVSRHRRPAGVDTSAPKEAFPPTFEPAVDLRVSLSLDPFEVPASTGRAGAPLRVGRGPSWTEPRPLRPPFREEGRLSRPGTPSAAEHPSRVFPRRRGFAATLRALALVFPPGDGSPGGETPGHAAEGHPSTTLREVSSTLDDFCNTNLTRGQHREPLDPRYRECPCGTPRPRSFGLKKRAERAGRRAMGLLPCLIRTRCPGGRTSRAGRNVSLLRDTCAPPVALPGWRRGRRTPCCPGAPRPGFHAFSRKSALSHESRCIPPCRAWLRPSGSLPSGCSRWPLARPLP